MFAPKRMTAPCRINAAAQPAMFPHTVTIYNLEIFKGNVEGIHITFLRGVLLEAVKAINVLKSGLESADAVSLYIPFGVEAVDGITGKHKKYAPPVEFWNAENQGNLWTLTESEKNGSTFFVKGEALPPEGTPIDEITETVELMYDHVYNITKVDEKDYGGLKHWEVGGA